MDLEIGDIVYYTFHSDFRGHVTVKAKVIDTYLAIYSFMAYTEVSLRYEDLGDVITEHGIAMDSPKIESI